MNKKCDQWNEEHYIGFSIYGSPIENTTYKFAKCLKKRFGIIEGITDRNYITNSYHTFVREPINAFDKLKKELIDIKYDALTRSSELMEKSRQSRIEEYVSEEQSDLQTSTNPPYVIKKD